VFGELNHTRMLVEKVSACFVGVSRRKLHLYFAHATIQEILVLNSQHKGPRTIVNTMENGFDNSSTTLAPTVAELAAMTTEERLSGQDHSEVRYFTRYEE